MSVLIIDKRGDTCRLNSLHVMVNANRAELAQVGQELGVVGIAENGWVASQPETVRVAGMTRLRPWYHWPSVEVAHGNEAAHRDWDWGSSNLPTQVVPGGVSELQTWMPMTPYSVSSAVESMMTCSQVGSRRVEGDGVGRLEQVPVG